MTKAQAYLIITLLAVIALSGIFFVCQQHQEVTLNRPAAQAVTTANSTDSQAAASTTTSIPSTKASPATNSYEDVYTVVCVGAIATFAECKPIIDARIMFHVTSNYGVTSRNMDLPPSLAPVQNLNNCSVKDAQNWVCIDSQGNKQGFSGGEYFSDVQQILNNVPGRSSTFLYVTRDQYESANLYLGQQPKTQ